MGYYCTVPQCTSLAGKTKNVKFHRFPRDENLADKWNDILKRGKPYTKYSKVCSLHFTQADYNVTSVGSMKTLSKDAVPSQNLPKLNPDGTVMIIRKPRTIKPKPKVDLHMVCQINQEWPNILLNPSLSPSRPASNLSTHSAETNESMNQYRIAISSAPSHSNVAPIHRSSPTLKTKQDAFIQTEPLQVPVKYEPLDNETNKSSETTSPVDHSNDLYQRNVDEVQVEQYRKHSDYGQQQHNYESREVEVPPYGEYNGTDDGVELVSGANFFPIKEEFGDKGEEVQVESYHQILQTDPSLVLQHQQRLIEQYNRNYDRIKTEPDIPTGHENETHTTFYRRETPETLYYQQRNSREEELHQTQLYSQQQFSQQPGAELLIAKQNALAAHPGLWCNTVKRPFFYSEPQQYSANIASPAPPHLLHNRFEDAVARVINQ